MRVLIIEDEAVAARRLTAHLLSYNPSLIVEKCVGSVEESMSWLSAHRHPDLILADIELSDGNVFEVFEKVPVDAPIIFITHHQSFVHQALEANGISYITKPISQEKINKGLRKYDSLKKGLLINWADLPSNHPSGTYRKRFVSRVNGHWQFASCETIAYFKTEFKATYLITFDGQKLVLDKSLNQIKEELDPQVFYRANRRHIISAKAIESIHNLSDGSELLTLFDHSSLTITRTKVKFFRKWFDR